jgi:hypothetical protein
VRKKLEGNLVIDKEDSMMPGEKSWVFFFTKLGHGVAMLLGFKGRNQEDESSFDVEQVTCPPKSGPNVMIGSR